MKYHNNVLKKNCYNRKTFPTLFLEILLYFEMRSKVSISFFLPIATKSFIQTIGFENQLKNNLCEYALGRKKTLHKLRFNLSKFAKRIAFAKLNNKNEFCGTNSKR